jgi:5-methylcytosine-specific restriction endonuclease McrA
MKNKLARLRGKADKLWYEDNVKTKCEICGKRYPLQVHHFFYKSQYGHLRYKKENAITLCQRCHFVLHHQDPKEITDQIISVRGQEWYQLLKKEAQNHPRSYINQKYYENVIQNLSQLPPKV